MISALLDLQMGSPEKVKQYSCASCPPSIKKLRKCDSPRLDFGPEDDSFWPIRIIDGGELYGFCPGKATWDQRTSVLYSSLIVCAETGLHWQSGGIADQPAWWMELCAWFLPRFNEMRFYQRARAILGDGKDTGKAPTNGSYTGTARNSGAGKR